MIPTTNYQKHLYFESDSKSKEYSLDKCMKVLAMISILKDRNQSIKDMCENLYGKSIDGKILAPERESCRFNGNLETIKRLKSYYNYCLSSLKGF